MARSLQSWRIVCIYRGTGFRMINREPNYCAVTFSTSFQRHRWGMHLHRDTYIIADTVERVRKTKHLYSENTTVKQINMSDRSDNGGPHNGKLASRLNF